MTFKIKSIAPTSVKIVGSDFSNSFLMIGFTRRANCFLIYKSSVTPDISFISR